MGLEKLFGKNNIINKNGDEISIDELAKNEVIAIQFSASWCGPCKQFNPVFIEAYEKMKADANKKFEVVFVSSDRDDDSFNDYYKSMPWLALKFEKRDIKAKLSKKFKVSGIPTVILVDGNGKLISKNGRALVVDTDAYPWPKKELKSILPKELLSKEGPVGLDALNGKYIGLYFSAKWCPPCQAFTPKLIEVYNNIKKSRDDFEIIFISSDRDQDGFNEYYGKMPWLALPYEERAAKNELSQFFEVNGIPTFVLLNTDLSILNANGRSAVMQDMQGKDFPWTPRLVNNIDNPNGINENTSLCVLVEGADAETQTKVEESLLTVAQGLKNKDEGKNGDDDDDDDDDNEILFFIGTNSAGVASRIRALTNSNQSESDDGEASKSSVMVILDIPDGGAYYKSDKEPTEVNIQQFINDYKDGKLKREQLS